MRNDGSQTSGKSSKEKFLDITVTTTATSTGSVTALATIPTGSGVRQRTGDTVRLLRMFINYDIDAINADVFTSTRVIIFQWLPNTTVGGLPTAANILQSVSTISMYHFQNANQYRILYDKVHFQAGITAAPTASGYQGYYGNVQLSSALKQLEFSEAVSTGSNQVFLLLVSNSLIAPFPNLALQSRVIYTEDF